MEEGFEMAMTYTDYRKSLTDYQQKLAMIRLKALKRKLSNDRVRLVQSQNRLAERKEQQERVHWQAQAERTQQLQQDIRAGLNNRWYSSKLV